MHASAEVTFASTSSFFSIGKSDIAEAVISFLAQALNKTIIINKHKMILNFNITPPA
jgi:hypothetical protein